MGLLRRHSLGRSASDEATEIIEHSRGSVLSAIVSVFALVFSTISLYQTVLKQPSLQLYVPPVIHYTRDANGNYEVFAIPVTIANHGARDGTVLSVDLDVKKSGDKKAKSFYSAYFVGSDYFATPPGFDRTTNVMHRPKRPKAPFAPISVAGRSAYSGTILFYKKFGAFPKMVSDKGTFSLTVKLNTKLDASLGYFDRWWRSKTAPVEFRAVLPFFSESSLLRGETVRLNNADWSAPVGESISESGSGR